MHMQNIFNETIEWLIYQARKLMKNKLQNELKVCGISTEQLSILNLIFTEIGHNQKQLAENSLKDGAAVTRILDVLEKKDLVRRENSPNDRREFLLYTTDKGNSVYNEAVKLVGSHTQEIDSIFSESEREQFKNLLNKLISNLK